MPGQNRKRAIKLLRQHDTRKFMWHGQRRKRKLVLCATAQFFRKSFCVATEKNQFPRAAVAQIAQPAGELLRSKLFPAGIEQDALRCGIQLELLERRRGPVAEFRYFDFSVACDACDIIVHQQAAFRAMRASEHEKSNFHWMRTEGKTFLYKRPYFLRFSSSVFRVIPRIPADFEI